MTNKVLFCPAMASDPISSPQTERVLRRANESFSMGLEFDEAKVGGAAIDATGVPLPDDETMTRGARGGWHPARRRWWPEVGSSGYGKPS